MNKFNILAWLLNLLILVLSLAPINNQIPKPIERSDLIYHGLAYATVCFLFLVSNERKKLWITLCLIVQGVVIEFLQPHFNRHFEFLDMVANTVGVILAFTVFQSFKAFSSKRSTGPSK